MDENDEERFDPFAGIADEPDPEPAGTREQLLASARRGYVPLRKTSVQKPNTETDRASVLAALVGGRHHRPFDALLLLHALQPVLDGTPLLMSTWARILSTKTVCTPNAATKAFSTLVDLKLATRSDAGRHPTITPLLEDGSGAAWSKPGLEDEEGPGYFTLPHRYWTDGYADRLTMPGKAMLLIMLAETQDPKKPTFTMAVERAQGWYGISERTAERGYAELHREQLLLVRVSKVVDKRHPAGRREVYHRALDSPFNPMDRARLQKAAAAAATGRAKGGQPSAGAPAKPARSTPPLHPPSRTNG